MRTPLKNLVYLVLAKSGFYTLWKKFNRGSVVFLTIHGVMDSQEQAEWEPTRPQISSRQLEECVRLISKYYKFISLDEAVKMLSLDMPMRSHCVVITFDDGYRNCLTHAWPILSKYKIPAILFAAVGHVQRRQCFWFDRLDYALQLHVENGGEYCQLGDERIPLDASDRAALQASIKSVILRIKALSCSDQEAMETAERTISGLEKAAGKSLNDLIDYDPWCGVMTWRDLRAARDAGMDIGSHTVDHARVALMGKDAARSQLVESKRMIEENLGQPCDYFCYPNGNYSLDVLPLVREAGYRAALTTEEGGNYPGDDLYRLKRVHMPQGRSPEEALAVAAGFTHKLSLLLRRVCGKCEDS